MKNILFTCFLLWNFGLSAQDYWSKAPVFPTGCYYEKDDYQNKVSALKTELKKISEEKNAAIMKKAESMSQEEKMKLAMQYQTMSPSEIVKMQNEQMEMVTLQQTTQEHATAVTNKFNDLEAQYNEAIRSRLEPIAEEVRKLPDGEGTPQWAIDKGAQLAAQYNKEYEALCAKYFTSPQALFKTWLSEYKQFLLEHDIPYTKKSAEMQYKQYGISGDDDLPVIEGVIKYNDYCYTIFSKRMAAPH